nr:DNA-directed RNA polymerase subunit [Cedratvirus borely]
MQELPDEVALMILEGVPVEELPSFCASNKRYRSICSDRLFWLDTFTRTGLPLLEEGVDFTSWVAIYRNSLLAKKKSDYIISFYEKKRTAWLNMCEPVPLYKIRHVELLGEEDPKLSALISVDIYSRQLKNTQELEERLRENGLPQVGFGQTKAPVSRSLNLGKRGDDFLLSVYSEGNIRVNLERIISKEKAGDILYRLCYYDLFEPHRTLFSTYREENRQKSTWRFPAMISTLTMDEF